MRGNHYFATRLFREIARRWPQDPVGYYNTIENLIEEEKWDEANRLFSQAPEGYRILALSQMQRTQMDNRAADKKPIRAELFYGQPEWDERLKIIPQVTKEPFKFGKK